MTDPAVLLISPGILRWVDRDFGLPHLVSLGGYVREHTGVRVELLDLNYEGGDHRDLVRTIESLGPFLLIGISCYSSFDYLRVMALARFLRDRFPDVPLVTGGYHASALPGDVIHEGSPFDAVLPGEAEQPLREIVEALLGGEPMPRGVFTQARVPELDELPPYQWDLLDRYWPNAHSIGWKLQIYLSRGCPYRCSFCMERAKSGYSWRPYSPERAVSELERLATYTDLSRWVINIADPLFGFRRRWRRQVLEGIAAKGLLPRQYWTLTRSDDLDDVDIELLANARFAIGIGLESGSPRMLRLMNKGNTPERYLDAVRRLARLSNVHGLNWAVNVIVGHPGETPQTAEETRAFIAELFGGPKTSGWLSIDPFRLYPGSWVHQTMDEQEATHGAHFYHREWWKTWYDGTFRAEHLDPGREFDFEQRVRWMHDTYAPIVGRIAETFVGHNPRTDDIYRASMAEQVQQLTPAGRDGILALGRSARERESEPEALRIPLGLNVRDHWVRQRESAIQLLLDQGVLQTDRVIEALVAVAPEAWMDRPDASELLRGAVLEPDVEGGAVASLPFRQLGLALEALEVRQGDVVVDLHARSAYTAALLCELVGPTGRVLVVPAHARWTRELETQLARLDRAHLHLDPTVFPTPPDRALLGAAIPEVPPLVKEALADGGRMVAFVGPRFRPQDLLVAPKEGPDRAISRARVPIASGRFGWLRRPRLDQKVEVDPIRFDRALSPALVYHVLSHIDLGNDAANLYDPTKPDRPWVPALRAALLHAPDRIHAQFVGLQHRHVRDLIATLRRSGGPVGPPLSGALLAAIEAERPAFESSWRATDASHRYRMKVVQSEIGETLQRLRTELYESAGRRPPSLLIADCRALGPHGRAVDTPTGRVVAVSLGVEPSHVLWQVLHEEMHPISDPHVPVPEVGRDTRQGAEGFAVHAALEAVAVAATEAFIAQHAPKLTPDLERWKARVSG